MTTDGELRIRHEPTDDELRIRHERFGELALRADEVLHFGGVPGFPEADRFALMRHDRNSPFGWLVSLDVLDLAFAVTDPRSFFPDYAPGLTATQLASIEAAETAGLEFLAIATVRDGRASLNLAAPIVLNARVGRGAQILLEGSTHPTRAALPEPEPCSAPPAGDAAAQIESKPQR